MTDHETTTAGPGRTPSGEPLVVTQHVAASRETVFDFLVDADKVLRWMGTAVDIDARPGGTFWLDANGTDIASGHYQEVVRPERVVFTFGWEGSSTVPAGSTTVTISLTEADDHTTTVELRHEGLPNGLEDQHREGWTRYLGRLAGVATV